MNVYNSVWNLYYHKKKYVAPLEKFINSYKLIVNNNPDCATCLLSQKLLSFISLALNSLELGPLSM